MGEKKGGEKEARAEGGGLSFRTLFLSFYLVCRVGKKKKKEKGQGKRAGPGGPRSGPAVLLVPSPLFVGHLSRQKRGEGKESQNEKAAEGPCARGLSPPSSPWASSTEGEGKREKKRGEPGPPTLCFSRARLERRKGEEKRKKGERGGGRRSAPHDSTPSSYLSSTASDRKRRKGERKGRKERKGGKWVLISKALYLETFTYQHLYLYQPSVLPGRGEEGKEREEKGGKGGGGNEVFLLLLSILPTLLHPPRR